jgi:hypothetical protein
MVTTMHSAGDAVVTLLRQHGRGGYIEHPRHLGYSEIIHHFDTEELGRCAIATALRERLIGAPAQRCYALRGEYCALLGLQGLPLNRKRRPAIACSFIRA